MKIKVEKLDIGKLETTRANLSKQIDAVKNEAIKENEYNKLVKKS